MKRWLAVAAALAIAVLAAGFIFRDAVGFLAMRIAISPKRDFSEIPAPEALDYSDDSSWGALPEIADPTDGAPKGLTDSQDEAQVAVFFVHPTTYMSSATWNQPPDHEETNELTDNLVFRGQASAFNGCCQIYAPRYRQATFFSFIDTKGNGEQALELAFGDVERAFENFLERIGEMPFVLAGHSQGSVHIERLLREHISAKPLRERLVAAYPMGYWFNEAELAETLPDVPVCETSAQTSCLATWNSVGPRVKHFEDPAGQICVNPLTWSTDGAAAEHESNSGSLALFDEKYLESGVADAQCVGGALLVRDIRSEIYEEMPPILGRDNFHIIDVHLFYRSVHENARLRANTYLAAREAQDASENINREDTPSADA